MKVAVNEITTRQWRQRVQQVINHYNKIEDNEKAAAYVLKWFKQNGLDEKLYPPILFILENVVEHGMGRKIADMLQPDYVTAVTEYVEFSVRVEYEVGSGGTGPYTKAEAVTRTVTKALDGVEWVTDYEIK